jgi:diguanylate cyclase (GGDEF)-like protein/PAS domain S-box-containing protein
VQRVDDVTRDPDYVPWTATSRSALAVPVLRDGTMRGILYFEDATRSRYTLSDVRILTALAGQAWIALRSEERALELSAATDRFGAAFGAAPSSLIISTRTDGKIVDANAAFLKLIGRTRADVIGRSIADLRVVAEATGAMIGEHFELDGRVSGMTVRTDRLDGTPRDFVVSAEAVDIGGESHVVTAATEITEATKAALENERLALYDSLTGLPNRNLFARRLEDALRSAARTGRSTTVLLMDLDHFKDVNDTFGHPFGDLVLRAVGTRIRAALADHETVARLGGDEFAIVVDGDDAAAHRVAGDVRRKLEAPIDLEGHAIRVAASVGVSRAPVHGGTATALLQRADIALYAAKAAGGGTIEYSAAIDAHSPSRLALAGELQRAIAGGELVLQYQPIVALQAGARTGVEALVRWAHPVRGMIPPADFIPAAERSGLIKPLTDWVLARALAGASRWRSGNDPLEIAVNISMRNLLDPELPASLARHIAGQAIDPSRVCLEITESVAMTDPERTIGVLTQLRDIGVRLAIDDFGTGYSSLAYLRRLPVHALKIDRAFVAGLAEDDASEAIVKATIDVGHALGLVVIAEGVEEERQLQSLRQLGCDNAQGYFIARPLEESGVLGWLESNPDGRYAGPGPLHTYLPAHGSA